MKILHVIGWYFPEGHGGSEVYLASLVRELRELGHESIIAVPSQGKEASDAVYEGVLVHYYAADATYTAADAYGDRSPRSVGELMRWVKMQKPDAVHFHSWAHDAAYWHLRAVQEAGFCVYLTLHTATPFCTRSTMLRWGTRVCDGEMRPVRCAACYFQQRDLMPALGWPLSVSGALLSSLGLYLPGRLGIALRFPDSLRLRREQLHATWHLCTRVVAVCEWVRKSLLLNGCPSGKIVLSRQGAAFSRTPGPKHEPAPDGALRFGFLGRLDYVKGAILLVEAFRKLRTSRRVVLELKGIPQDESYLERLRQMIGKDDRIHLMPPESPEKVQGWLRSLDALVVPSRWLETGPLVVYEAFAAGVPVIGAGQGGIAELVRAGVDGVLFQPNSSQDLTRVLQEVCADPAMLSRLREGIRPVRPMKEVAVEMDAMYREGMTL